MRAAAGQVALGRWRRWPWRLRSWLSPRERAAAQGAVKSVYKDWQIRCDNPPGAKSEQCALIQSVTSEDRANVGLTVIVLKTADQKSKLMRVVAPLGVLLPSGLGLEDRPDRYRPRRLRALPAERLHRRSGDGRRAVAETAQRQDRDLHHLPDSGRRHRLPDEPRGVWRRVRQVAVRAAVAARRRRIAAFPSTERPYPPPWGRVTRRQTHPDQYVLPAITGLIRARRAILPPAVHPFRGCHACRCLPRCRGDRARRAAGFCAQPTARPRRSGDRCRRPATPPPPSPRARSAIASRKPRSTSSTPSAAIKIDANGRLFHFGLTEAEHAPEDGRAGEARDRRPRLVARVAILARALRHRCRRPQERVGSARLSRRLDVERRRADRRAAGARFRPAAARGRRRVRSGACARRCANRSSARPSSIRPGRRPSSAM